AQPRHGRGRAALAGRRRRDGLAPGPGGRMLSARAPRRRPMARSVPQRGPTGSRAPPSAGPICRSPRPPPRPLGAASAAELPRRRLVAPPLYGGGIIDAGAADRNWGTDMTSEWVINRKTANSVQAPTSLESVLLRMRSVTTNINRCWRDAVA